jgi:hypothetical protein
MGQVYSRDISTASFMGRMVGAHIFDFAEPDVSAILWHVPSFLRAHTGRIIAFMSPAPFTPEKECYTVLFLQIFREPDINER